jgi:DNA polymerase III alpha subunit
MILMTLLSNPLTETDLLELLYQERSGPVAVDQAVLDLYDHGCYELGLDQKFTHQDLPSADQLLETWSMPDEYKNIDLERFFAQKISTAEEIERVSLELELYKKNGLYTLLKYLIYTVDVMKENNIVWGVGRGSSVSSYLLYLVGLHSVNPLKYKLDIKEFFR